MHDRWNVFPMSHAWRNAERNLMKLAKESKHARLLVLSHFHMFQLYVDEFFRTVMID